MAKIVFACVRGGAARFTEEHFNALASQLCPENIKWPSVIPHMEGDIAAAILGGAPGVGLEKNVIWVGQVEQDPQVTSLSSLEGTYAICRWTDSRIEAATDVLASRTLWYCHTDELFLVSTSQRAIAALLGDFQISSPAMQWMLSSGSLGPGNGWDARMRRLGPDSTLTLDRASWKLTVHERPVVFQPEHKKIQAHKADLEAALDKSCAPLAKLVGAGWRLPLSGGVDSRCLLLMMVRNGIVPQCLTWGREDALREPGNDAYIARQLAEQLGAPHEYAPLDGSGMNIDIVTRRFLEVGEGRVDHISGYMDGFEIWRKLFDSGVTGIIRGDEGFGWKAVASERQVRFELGLMLMSDYFDAGQLSSWELETNDLPAAFGREDREGLAGWRDRLYHQFRIPVILAALNDLKCGHVEIVNPLLSRRVIDVARHMPEDLRTEKRLFQSLVMSMSPSIPLARKPAIASPKDIMGTAAFRGWMQKQLELPEARYLPAAFREKLLMKVADKAQVTASSGTSAKAIAKRFLPPTVAAHIKNLMPVQRPVLDWNVLAFRACLVVRSARMLACDAALLPPRQQRI